VSGLLRLPKSNHHTTELHVLANELMIAHMHTDKTARHEELIAPWLAEVKANEPEVTCYRMSSTSEYETWAKTYSMYTT
jgi:hypothetical protein